MIQSMTGYAERSSSIRTLRVKIGIKSLNHRYFDWSLKGVPLGGIEGRLRVLCQEKIHRGRIEATVDAAFPDPSSWDVDVNEGLLEKILTSFGRVAARAGREIPFSLDNLFRIPQLVELRRKDFTRAESDFLVATFTRVLDDLAAVRRAEGRRITIELKTRLVTLRGSVSRIEALVRKHPRAVQKKLRARLQEANGQGPTSEERLAEEVAYLTQRYDVAEEIARLKHHLAAAQGLLSARAGEPAGRMLDFLAQEMTREANTLNSKSQDIGITREGLLIKSEVESIRQQVQNIE